MAKSKKLKRLSTIPKKTQSFELDGLYEGIEFEANLGYPLSLAEEMMAGDIAAVVKGLCQIVTSWNLADEDDKPLPINEQTLRQIPQDLIGTMANTVGDAIGKVEKKS